MKHIRIFILTAVIISLIVFACGDESESDQGHLAAYLPERFVDLDFQREGKVETYAGSSLWEYVNGGAEIYQSYNFVEVAVADYQRDGVEIVADVYEFRTPLDAYGLYTMFRSPGDQVIDLGVEGFVAPASVSFVKGPHLVRLTGFDETTESSLALTNLAAAIEEKIPGTTIRPPVFSVFPDENKIMTTDQYSAESFLGQNFLTGVYSQDYLFDGDTLTLFLTDDKMGDKFAKMMPLAEASGISGDIPPEINFDENYGLFYHDSIHGRILLGLKSGWLVGMIDYKPERKDFFRTWIEAIE